MSRQHTLQLLAFLAILNFARCSRRLAGDLSDSDARTTIESLGVSTGAQPNVLLVVVDDLGWKDVGFHDPMFSTPYLDSMVEEGIELSTFYTAPTCTPSRAQLMTGRYSFRTGMQDSVLHTTEPRGVPLTEVFLSQKLKDAGYSTAVVGKWHLGMHMPQYLPQKRGFDRQYGILTGGGGHYNHVSVSQEFTPRGAKSETRLFQGQNILEDGYLSEDNKATMHSTELYTKKAAEYITSMSAEEQPWFLYLSYQAIHDPIETDDVWIQNGSCEKISQEVADIGGTVGDETDWENRRVVCGMVSQMDHGLGQIRDELEGLGEWNNTVIIFLSDNGGLASHGSVNHPFRGGKGDYWEGGVHVPAFVSGGYLTTAMAEKNVEPYRYGHLTHITDVHATVLGLAGYSSDDGIDLDGVDLWKSLVETQAPKREAVIINLNSPNFASSAAARWGKYKLMRNAEPIETAIYARVRSTLQDEGLSVSEAVLQEATTKAHAQLHLTEPRMYLFDLEANPSETNSGNCLGDDGRGPVEACSNLYDLKQFRSIRRRLETMLEQAQGQSVLPTLRWMDDGPLADPLNFGGWIPWRDDAGDPLANYGGYETALDGLSDSRNGGGSATLSAVDQSSSQEFVSMSVTSLSVFGVAAALITVGATVLAYREGRRSGSGYSSLKQ